MMMLGGQGRGSQSFNITTDQTDWNLVTDGFGGSAPTVPQDIQINISASVEVVASSSAVAALDLTGMPDETIIAVVNLGEIYGAGGNGGKGGNCEGIEETSFCGGFAFGQAQGSPGGPAIVIDGDVDLNLTNAAGLIFAGGGGGGGGDSCYPVFTPCCCQAGGGGGGGAGGSTSGGVKGQGGSGGNYAGDCNGDADDGTNGTGGSSGDGGAGGDEKPGFADCSGGGVGGTGGGFGDAGAVGGSGGAGGGAAGLAVDNNGTGTTAFVSGGVQGTDVKGTVE